MVRDGIADGGYVNPGYQPGRFPIIAAGELPFLMANGIGGSEALDTWYRKYAAKEMKDVHFCFAFVHDPGGLHSRSKKIVLPSDISGLKVRPADATIGQFVTLLGGTNVQASAPEARDVLERGVADAITFPWDSTVLFGIDKVDQVPHGFGALCHDLRLGAQQGEIRRDVAGAEEGDRRPLHHRMGRQDRRALGRIRKRPAAPRSRQSPGTRSIRSPPSSSPHGARRRRR